MDAPATLSDARDLWPDADTITDDTLTALLTAAWETCEAFIPAEQIADQAVAGNPPARWIQANVLHARDLWTAYRREGDVIGFDQYAVRVAPLAGSVRQLLRPARGRPLVG